LERGGIPSLFTSYQHPYSQTNAYQNSSIMIVAARGLTGKGANRVLFFGAENGHAQMAKNRHGCLFRTPFLWLLSFGGAKESDNYPKRKRVPF
jgi:hypothetical protein